MDRSRWSRTSSLASGTDGVFSECRSLSWVRGAARLSPRARHCFQSLVPGDPGRVQRTVSELIRGELGSGSWNRAKSAGR